MFQTLPRDILVRIGRLLFVNELLQLQKALGRELEDLNIISLRYRYEPYTYQNIVCNYVRGSFHLVWTHGDYTLHWNDKRSRSNREAVKSMYDLLN